MNSPQNGPTVGSYISGRLALIPGIALSGLIALAATFVSDLHGGPQLLFALFFGVAFHFLSFEPKSKPGIEFCARGVLRLGVGLLGARITADQIAGLGWTTALIVIGAVVTTLLCGAWLGKKIKHDACARGIVRWFSCHLWCFSSVGYFCRLTS
jgi:uncharacterized membrane protein YadS